MPIYVSLTTSVKPPVTVSPDPCDVSAGTVESITWMPATGQNFTFKGLSFANKPSSMGTPNVTLALVTVQDTNGNNPGSPSTTYPYTVMVEYNGQSYSSVPLGIDGNFGDSAIRNCLRAPSMTVQKPSIVEPIVLIQGEPRSVRIENTWFVTSHSRVVGTDGNAFHPLKQGEPPCHATNSPLDSRHF